MERWLQQDAETLDKVMLESTPHRTWSMMKRQTINADP